MTDSFKGGNFDPIESEDYVAPLTQSYKEINDGMNNYWDQEISNYNYKASFAGKNLEALANMSSTLSATMAKQEEKRKKENISKGMLWLKENPLDIIHQERFEAEIERLKAEGKEIDEFVGRYEKKEDSDIWTSQSFRDLNGAQKYGAVVSWVEGKVQEYDPANNPELVNATNYQEYKAAENKASIQLYDKLGDLNSALVYKHVIGPQKEKEDAAYSAWNTKREAEIKAERIKIATNNLESCMANGQLGCHVDFMNERAAFVGQGNANKEYFSALSNLAGRGKLTSNQITDIELKHRKNRIKSKVDGKEYWFNDFFSSEFDAVKEKAIEFEGKLLTQNTKKKNSAALIRYNEEVKRIQGDNFDVTKGYSQDQLSELRAVQMEFITTGVTGEPLRLITNAISYGSADKLQIADMKSKALKEAKAGILTTDRLNNEFPLVASDTELKNAAARNDAPIKLRKENHKAIELLISTEPTVEGGATAGEIKVIGHFKRKYDALVKQYDSLGMENPENTAYLQIKGEVEQAVALEEDKIEGNETFKVNNDWQYFPEKLSDPTSLEGINNQLIEKLNSINKITDDIGIKILDTQQLFPNKSIEEWEKGDRIPTFAHEIAKGLTKKGITNEDGSVVTGYDVMKRQSKISNYESANKGVGITDPSFVNAFKELHPSQQKLCTLSDSPTVTGRVIATSGKENIDFIPFDQGLFVSEKAEEKGMLFSEYSAALEILPKLGISLDAFENGEDIFNLMDDHDFLEYNKSVWKWSGGTNKDALSKTIRLEEMRDHIRNKIPGYKFK